MMNSVWWTLVTTKIMSVDMWLSWESMDLSLVKINVILAELTNYQDFYLVDPEAEPFHRFSWCNIVLAWLRQIL